MKPSWKRSGLIYILILIAAVALFSWLLPGTNQPTEIPLSEAIMMSKDSEIEKVVVDGENLIITSVSGKELTTAIGNLTIVDLKDLGFVFPKGYEIKGSSGINWGLLINFLPIIIFGALLFFLFRRAQGANNQAFSFGRSRARLFSPDRPTVTFDDVAGVEEAKQEVSEVVEFLKTREKFVKLGARIPKGMLLVGPPGTGKTLLARAIAGEAAVPFFSISGSEFVEMFVGVGASRVRDLFEQAKRNAPCIVFIDEIDAVGRQRGSGLGGSHDEREQTLNQILVEMDGFDTNISVIVLAATNRPDILDPALLRPGRFDRRVVLDLPDIVGRLAILKVHSKGKPLADSVNLEVLAKQTAGFSGADLANLINEAAILAARRSKIVIETKELEESIDRVIAGPERKSRKISPKEKEITAYHEGGHALVARMLPNADPVHKISIVARGMSLGHTRYLPAEDRYMMTRSQFLDMIATFLAGHTAEDIIFHETTTGAADDIKRATHLARRMVTDYGMSDILGPRTFGHRQELIFLGREISEQRDYSEKVAEQIDDEVHKIIESSFEVARKIILENQDKLVKIAKALLDKETLEFDDLEVLIKGTSPQLPQGPVAPAVLQPEAKTKPRTKPAFKESPATPPPLPETGPSHI